MPFDTPDGPALRGMSIVVVDDNLDARVIFSSVLRQAGGLVAAAGTAMGAARRLRHLRPDVVITDLSMPRHDGLWLLRTIRERDAMPRSHTPVIAVTARDDLYEIDRLGFDRCFVKPVPWGDLVRAIRSVTTPHAASA